MKTGRWLLILWVSTLFLSASDLLKTTYRFSNVSVNYLDWSDTTKARSGRKEFPYLEFEGGTGHVWGETYIFADVRNPTKSYDDKSGKGLAFALKPTLDIKLKGHLAFHIQDYILQSKPYRTNDAVVGLSYKIKTDFGFWTKPFIGWHHKSSTYYSGSDGYMAGWLLNFAYKKFSIFQWHEMTFDRDKNDGYGNHIGIQGSIKFWYNPTHHFSTGIQYRYAHYELGSHAYQWGWIYSIKYNF